MSFLELINETKSATVSIKLSNILSYFMKHSVNLNIPIAQITATYVTPTAESSRFTDKLRISLRLI